MKVAARLRTINNVETLVNRLVPQGAQVLVEVGEALKPETLLATFKPPHERLLQTAAGFWGRVEFLKPGLVTLSTRTTQIIGVAGAGPKKEGLLFVYSPDEPLSLGHLRRDLKGKIVVAASVLESEFFPRAEKLGLSGLVLGGLRYLDYRRLKNLKIGLLLCEGFGNLPLGLDIWQVLSRYNNRYAIIEGKLKTLTIGLHLEEAPENEKPRSENLNVLKNQKEAELTLGAKVRLLGSFLGHTGLVEAISDKEETLESGLKAFVARVRVGERLFNVPVQNLEVILEVK